MQHSDFILHLRIGNKNYSKINVLNFKDLKYENKYCSSIISTCFF